MMKCFENPIFNRTFQVERRKYGLGPKAWVRRCGVAALIWLVPLGLIVLFSLQDLREQPRQIFEKIYLSIGISAFFMLLHCISKAAHGTLNGISLEKEQKTYESLQSTLLSAHEIVAGKLLTGIWPTLRDLGVTLPLALVLGLASGHLILILGSYAIILASAVVLACMGLVCSYTAATTQGAMQQSSAWVAALLFGSPLLALLFNFKTLYYFCPFGAYAELFSNDASGLIQILNPLPYLALCACISAGLWQYLGWLERRARRVK